MHAHYGARCNRLGCRTTDPDFLEVHDINGSDTPWHDEDMLRNNARATQMCLTAIQFMVNELSGSDDELLNEEACYEVFMEPWRK